MVVGTRNTGVNPTWTNNGSSQLPSYSNLISTTDTTDLRAHCCSLGGESPNVSDKILESKLHFGKSFTDGVLAQLDFGAQFMDAAQTLDSWAEADLRFHEAVLQATGNELLSSLFSVIDTALGTFFVLSARNSSNFRYSLPHHQKVLEAIRRKQPKVAHAAMLAMIADSQANLRRSRSKARKARA